jgi:DNA invertase Pin-like site-specific DNA recombinase
MLVVVLNCWVIETKETPRRSKTSISERVRDKVAASKKKGLWMGGMPPLGYDVENRKLIVNEAEAQTRG